MKTTTKKTLGFDAKFLKWTVETVAESIDPHKAILAVQSIEEDLATEEGRTHLAKNQEETIALLRSIDRELDDETLKARIRAVQKKLISVLQELRDEKTWQRQERLLETLKRRIDAVQRTIGSALEIVLHDVRNYPTDPSTLCHIAGNVTDRLPGSPMTPLGHGMLHNGIDERINYQSD